MPTQSTRNSQGMRIPHNMSFSLTTQQARDKTKDVTRRLGWWFLEPGDIVQQVEKARGLKKGGNDQADPPIRNCGNKPRATAKNDR
jgi:hypothetical protein